MYSYVDRYCKKFFIKDSFRKYSYLAYILLPCHGKNIAYLLFEEVMSIQVMNLYLEFMF